MCRLRNSFTYVINLNKAGLLSVYAADSEWNERHRRGLEQPSRGLVLQGGRRMCRTTVGTAREGGEVTFSEVGYRSR